MSKRPSTTDHDRSVTESGDDEPFLNRWARRKRVARAGGDVDTTVGESSVEEPPMGEAAEARTGAGEDSQAPELTDEDMPSVDGIDENTDMSGFFSPKVSQAVKKVALRKFFHSPIFNIVDGLDDYDEDFRNFEALGDIVTSDMRGIMERQAERAREAVAGDGQEGATPPSSDARSEQDDDSEKQDGEQKDRRDEPSEIAEEHTRPEQMAAIEAGVTREPGQRAGMAGGKLRPGVKDR
jgi:hypothetical protein